MQKAGAHVNSLLTGFSAIPVLGICAFRISAWSVFGSTYIDYTPEAFSISRLAQLLGIFVIMLVSTRWAISRKAQLAGIVCATLGMTAGAVLCLVCVDPASTLFTGSRLLHGACSAVLIMGWGAYTCGHEPRKTAVYVSLAFVLYGATSFALQGAGELLSGLVTIGSPLLSGALLCIAPQPISSADARAEKKTEGTAIPRARRQRDALGNIDWAPAIMLLACCVVCSISDLLVAPMSGGTSAYTANAFRVLAFLVLACVFCTWVFALRRDDPDQLWPLYSCTVFFGLLGFSSFSFVNPIASLSFMQATQDCIMLFAWVFVAGTCYRQHLPRLIAFGMGTTLYMRTDIISNILTLLGIHLDKADDAAAVALSFAMAAALIVYTVMLLGRKIWGEKSSSRDTGGSAASTDMPAELAGCGSDGVTASGTDSELSRLDLYDLSAREQQVVNLLLRGYTLPQVGERLGVSLNTARYYAKGIYRKLDIHSKAELIDLAEGRK